MKKTMFEGMSGKQLSLVLGITLFGAFSFAAACIGYVWAIHLRAESARMEREINAMLLPDLERITREKRLLEAACGKQVKLLRGLHTCVSGYDVASSMVHVYQYTLAASGGSAWMEENCQLRGGGPLLCGGDQPICRGNEAVNTLLLERANAPLPQRSLEDLMED